MVIFEGDPSGSPSKNGMIVISDRNYNVWARDPLGIPQFFSFNTATVWRHAHNDMYWYAQKSRGIVMISYLLWYHSIFAEILLKHGLKPWQLSIGYRLSANYFIWWVWLSLRDHFSHSEWSSDLQGSPENILALPISLLKKWCLSSANCCTELPPALFLLQVAPQIWPILRVQNLLQSA